MVKGIKEKQYIGPQWSGPLPFFGASFFRENYSIPFPALRPIAPTPSFPH